MIQVILIPMKVMQSILYGSIDDSSESEEFYKPVNNMNNMKLPVDTMKEILYSADIETYINLCNTSKEFKKLCNTWKLKFNQYGIDTENINDFNHGVRLYKKYLQDLKLYDTVDIFMKEFEKHQQMKYMY